MRLDGYCDNVSNQQNGNNNNDDDMLYVTREFPQEIIDISCVVSAVFAGLKFKFVSRKKITQYENLRFAYLKLYWSCFGQGYHIKILRKVFIFQIMRSKQKFNSTLTSYKHIL